MCMYHYFTTCMIFIIVSQHNDIIWVEPNFSRRSILPFHNRNASIIIYVATSTGCSLIIKKGKPPTKRQSTNSWSMRKKEWCGLHEVSYSNGEQRKYFFHYPRFLGTRFSKILWCQPSWSKCLVIMYHRERLNCKSWFRDWSMNCWPGRLPFARVHTFVATKLPPNHLYSSISDKSDENKTPSSKCTMPLYARMSSSVIFLPSTEGLPSFFLVLISLPSSVSKFSPSSMAEAG